MNATAGRLTGLMLVILLAGCRAEPQQTTTIAVVPAKGEFTQELNGLKLWYRVSGNGPVCLMPTPAWGPSSDLYFRTLQPLEKHFTIVYLDSRGTGRSQRAKATTEYTWGHLVSDLDALRAHLKQDKVWLMGHSEGGSQVLHYAARYPDRVNGLVLLATAAVINDEDDADMKARLARRQGKPWFAEAMTGFEASPTTDEEFAASMKKALPLYWSDPAQIKNHVDAFALTTLSAEAGRGATDSKRFPYDVRAGLRSVTAPALIVAGDDDFICSPFAAERLHLSLRNSKLLLIEKSGHFPWLEQADVFNREVPRFLEALGLPRRSG